MQSYLDMIQYRRPHGSTTETTFINRFIRPLGVTSDDAGNLIKRIGTAPVLWSCHVDTVHRMEGIQDVILDGNNVRLHKRDPSNCLGADCTTGVWIMIEMIKAGTEGLYIFHRGEECGGIGSSHIARKTPDLLKDIKYAIAFDRYDRTSVITHQFGRCASDAFADSLILQMPKYVKDTGGIFTDTANYTDIIPECTNLSVGYFGHHGKDEIQQIDHMVWLKDQMNALDITKLVTSRNPGERDYGGRFGGFYGRAFGYADYDFMDDDDSYYYRRSVEAKPAKPPVELGDPLEDLVALILENPLAVADLLNQYGITKEDLEAFMYA